MLVSAVQSGELDLPAYCDILRERVVRDKVSFIGGNGEVKRRETQGRVGGGGHKGGGGEGQRGRGASLVNPVCPRGVGT